MKSCRWSDSLIAGERSSCSCCFMDFPGRLPADVFNTFKCVLLPVRMFLDCSGAATVRAAGIESNRGKSAQSGTKWKSGFKKRCKELGEVPQLRFWSFFGMGIRFRSWILF